MQSQNPGPVPVNCAGTRAGHPQEQELIQDKKTIKTGVPRSCRARCDKAGILTFQLVTLIRGTDGRFTDFSSH